MLRFARAARHRRRLRGTAPAAVMLFGSGLMLAMLPAPAPAAPGEAAREAVARFHTKRSDAIEPLKAAIVAEPLIASALRTLLAESLLARGRAAEARAAAERVMADDARWAHRAAYLAARATLAVDCKAAIQHLERATVDPPWVREAPRLALMSAAHARCADAETAAAVDRRLAIEYPETPEGEAAMGRVSLTVEDQLARAGGFERARDYASAARLLESLAAGEGGDEARFRLAELHLDRIRDDFARAGELFAQVAAAGGERAEEAKYLQARAHGRKGDVVGALAGYRAYLDAHPKGAFAEDARFFSAFLQYEYGRYLDAARAFSPLRAAGKWRTAATWYHAWCLYLGGKTAEALPLFEAIAAAQRGRRAGRQAAYWAARAMEKSAPAEAAERRAALIEANPYDWYALLIRRRHPGEHPDVPPLRPPTAASTGTVPPMFLSAAVEIEALAAAGLPGFARRALAALSPALRAADGWDAEATLARVVSDPERLYRATATRHRALLVQPPADDPAAARAWRGAHPRPWPAAVRAAIAGTDVAAPLVWSFIRKESAFDPDAVSPAHAVGLMQLLPRTARSIVDARSQPGSSVPDLFDPAANIDLGAWYLDALSARFGGQLPLIAAAYNAGPRSLVSWFRGRQSVPTDLFVDTIPFRETREYVKLLVATRVGYAVVHDGQGLDAAAAVLPIDLDLTVRAGVDF